MFEILREQKSKRMGVSKVVVYPEALRDGRPIADVFESLIQFLRTSFAHVDSSPFAVTIRSFSVADSKPSEVVKEFFLVHFDPPSPSPSPSPSTATTSLKSVDYFALEEVPLRTHGVLYSSVPSPQRLFYSVVSGDEPMESLLLATKMFTPARLHHIQHIEVSWTRSSSSFFFMFKTFFFSSGRVSNLNWVTLLLRSEK